MSNPYLELTEEFNRGRLRALVSSGQAVVLHRLAIMSKDGDWILREDAESLDHVLAVLSRRRARYRFGAPLDLRWLAGGWSCHFEHRWGGLRLRTDFVTRPPRISADRLARIWAGAEAGGTDVVGLEDLAAIKQTNREKDYAVIGELARRIADPGARFLYSRSARDLIQMAEEYPDALAETIPQRPLLAQIAGGREALEQALDGERRALIRANEERLLRYRAAAEPWAAQWPDVARRIAGLPLPEAHAVVTSSAEGVLPTAPAPGEPR